MMRILLTGSAGQVGGALLDQLRERAEIIAPTRQEFDFSKPAELTPRLEAINPDIIINPAAYTAVDRAEEESDLAFRINALAPGSIARWAAKRRVPLVHFSTDYVFDGSGVEPWQEDSRPAPLSVYGASKLEGENAIRAAGGPHLIVRTAWVYSATGANFLRTIVRLASERKELSIVTDQIGAPTSARAIAEAIVRIFLDHGSAFSEVLASRSGLVNVVCSGETSWYGFGSAIVSGLKAQGLPMLVENIAPIRTDAFPAKAKRPANSRLSLSRLLETFGISMPSWEQALARELDELVLLHRARLLDGHTK